MQRYTCSKPLALAAGTLVGLSDAQAGARKHALKPQAKGVYLASGPLSFKAGEVVGLDGPNLKRLADTLVPSKIAARQPA